MSMEQRARVSPSDEEARPKVARILRNLPYISSVAKENTASDGSIQINAPLIIYINEEEKDGRYYIKALEAHFSKLTKWKIERDNFGGRLVPRDTYRWILHNHDFNEWRNGRGANVLWVKGDEGMGKTFLFCGILDELSDPKSNDVLAYYFCDPQITRKQARVALCSLIHELVSRWPDLIQHFAVQYEQHTNMLKDANACYLLGGILRKMLEHISRLNGGGVIYLAIDAFDVCEQKVGKSLLEEIANLSRYVTNARLRWLVTSRGRDYVGRGIQWPHSPRIVDLKDYKGELKNAARAYVLDFVLLEDDMEAACGRLLDQYLPANLKGFLELVATEANSLKDMLSSQADKREPAAVKWLVMQEKPEWFSEFIVDLYQKAASTARVAYRPLREEELYSFFRVGKSRNQDPSPGTIFSFLSIKDGIVGPVNKSAKRFFQGKGILFSLGLRDEHRRVFRESLSIMNETLQLGPKDLRAPGQYACEYWIEHCIAGQYGSSERDFDDELVAFLQNHFLDWIQHLAPAGPDVLGRVFGSWPRLMNVVKDRDKLKTLTTDAYRFIAHCGPAIAKCPTQIHDLALLFTPTESQKLKSIQTFEPVVSIPLGMRQQQWSPWLRTLAEADQLRPGTARAMVFSPDGTQLASATDRGEVKVWDVETGRCRLTAKAGEGKRCPWFCFLPHRALLATAAGIATCRGTAGQLIRFWDTLHGGGDTERALDLGAAFSAAAFLPDGLKLAAADEENISVWAVDSGSLLHRTRHRRDAPHALACASTGVEIVSAHRSGVCLWRMGPDGLTRGGLVRDRAKSLVAFRPRNGQRLAVARPASLQMGHIRLAGDPPQAFALTYDFLDAIVALPSRGGRLAVASRDGLDVWDVAKGMSTEKRIRTFKGLDQNFVSLALSPDGSRVASASESGLKIWDVSRSGGVGPDARNDLVAPRDHQDEVCAIEVSADGSKMVSASADAVLVWDPVSGEKRPCAGAGGARYVVLSHGGELLALCPASGDAVQIWDVADVPVGEPQRLSSIPHKALATPSFSRDGTRIAIMTDSCAPRVFVWRRCEPAEPFVYELALDIGTPEPRGRLGPGCVAFAAEEHCLAASLGGTITIWDLLQSDSWGSLRPEPGTGTEAPVTALRISPCQRWVAASFGGASIMVWDTKSTSPADKYLTTLQMDQNRVDLVAFVEADSSQFRFMTNTGLVLFRFDEAKGEWQRSREGYGINLDGGWITVGECDTNVLQLPPDYRPRRATVVPRTSQNGLQVGAVVLGTYSGRIVALSFAGGY